jgi:3-hydroxy-9,10-secoandrosta-1,3,5(10)-triene-9,17-dione monooxygenase reductase component
VSLPKQDLRTVMGHFATGVCVVGARRGDGSPVATTVNAVTSVSLEPDVDFSEQHPGLPCLPNALATVACSVSAMHRGGDHMIVIGEALSMSSAQRRDVAPLLFFRGSYASWRGSTAQSS